MILQKITLENIRSYSKPEPIEIGTGITLFEGDIGSGKSTILSAIEFALFGIGDVTGEYLLRHGASTGSVTLDFSVNNKQYQVHRILERAKKKVSSKKGKSVQQSYGYIIEESEKTEYAVTEMKNRVLKILEFNERPQAKTSSLIYRYAVFTPQEMMKEVLNQKVEDRLDTLRRAFRIEDYSFIANNTSVLSDWLQDETKLLDRQTKDFDEKREELNEVLKTKKEDNIKLGKLNRELNGLSEKRLTISAEINANQTKKDQLTTLLAEIPLMQDDLKQTNNTLAEEKKRLSSVNSDLNAITVAEQVLIQITPLYNEYELKNSKLDELEPNIQENQTLSNRKELLANSIQNAKSKIVSENESYAKDMDAISKKIKKQESATAKIAELVRLQEKLSTEIGNAPKYSEILLTLNQQHSSLVQDSKNKQERVDTLDVELKDLRGIGIGAPCPKCKQQLTPQHYGKVEQEYIKEIEELTSKIKSNKEGASAIKSQITDASDKESALKETEKKLNETNQALAKLGEAKEALEGYQKDYSEKQALLNTNQKKLAENDYALVERQQLEQVIVQLKKLVPIVNEYNELKTRVKSLEKQKVKEQYSSNIEKIGRKNIVNKQLSVVQSKISELEQAVTIKQQAIQAKQNEYEAGKPILELLKELDVKKNKTQAEYDGKNRELSAKQQEIENEDKEIKRLQGEIATREFQMLRSDEMKQYYLWLENNFVQAVKVIERNVLSSINEEFNMLFKNWFNQLIETGDITVRADETFTPIIEQNGYEMDVNSLSGGEKTSVALAYRLALNVMVKKVCDAMHSNLLILDEPTDGFSREQLFRLRDILNELKCEQVITVSHEAELEGFVDKIFRIIKVNGESKIQAV
jgi:exonuclease SbcC